MAVRKVVTVALLGVLAVISFHGIRSLIRSQKHAAGDIDSHIARSLRSQERVAIDAVPQHAQVVPLRHEHEATKVPEPLVNTECGSVRGVDAGKVYVWRGISYAKADRWRPPKRLGEIGACWAPKIFNATALGTPCVNIHGTGTEDCLTLTVWAPKPAHDSSLLQRELLPVMVYFHGGDLTGGATGIDFSLLASHGNGAVVIDVNYRLSLAGFLSIEPMVAESASGTSGSYGFLDMLESLRWTQRNAHAFGGDASRVMIFGQSSGGTAVMALLASPLASGLFSSVMSLSGSPNISMAADIQRKQHAMIAKAAGCASGTDSEVMACLRKESLEVGGRLFNATPVGPSHAPGTDENPSWSGSNIFDMPRYRDGLRMAGLAVVDGLVVREKVQHAYELGRNDVPVIFSSMAQECGKNPGENVSALSAEDFVLRLEETYFPWRISSLGAQVAAIYADEIMKSPQLAFDSINADIEMTCGNLELALAAARGFKKSAVYYVYNNQHADDGYWAYHVSDLTMATKGEGARANALRDAWHEFAATGKVTGWQTVDSASPSVSVRLNNDGTVSTTGWKESVCRFWRDAGFGPEFWWSN